MALAIAENVGMVREAVSFARGRGALIGLVPTMGALHGGHISLIRAARTEVDFIVVSIFVNPAQFGPGEDLARYPRPFEKDRSVCAAEGVDLIFRPEPGAMYPPGYRTYVEVHGLQDVLCGPRRPGHFRGVATVVLKLFNIVLPDKAYFGQKDAQQTRLIQQMVRDLDLPITIRACPIVREPDGLALSSRNAYLSPPERRQAVVLHQALEEVRRLAAAGERRTATLIQKATAMIAAAPAARIDYVSIVDPDALQPLDAIQSDALVALAVFFGGTRLIDNVTLHVKD